ncbi:octopamine receptor beta-2R-like [Homarus americanus]|nr:octopamine receptor beta-2R-like [Homarus americanus]AOG12995.1 octopamine receptor beta-3R [Homarus americanus]
MTAPQPSPPPLHRKTPPPLLLLLLLLLVSWCPLLPHTGAWGASAAAATVVSPPATSLIKSSTPSVVTVTTATIPNTPSPATTSTTPSTLITVFDVSCEPCLPAVDITSTRESRRLRHEANIDENQNNSVHKNPQETELSQVTTSLPAVYFDYSTPFFGNETWLGAELEVKVWSNTEVGVTVVKAIVMCTIIVVSVLGNVLVIVSVALHRRLHSTANYLLVSLATADMLVALCAMTFNASVELSGGRWMFGRVMCDLWNSFDVYFSTVSILHLCCISVDRYYAIVRPLEYPLTITRRILAVMLAHCWLAPTLISFLPILLGWYTTADHLRSRDTQPYVCAFVVNAVFALVSSAVSFWVPCTVMVVMYFRIFQEARKQERMLLSRASSANSASYSSSVRLSTAPHQQRDPAAAAVARQQLLAALQSTPFTPAPRHQEFLMKTFTDTSSTASVATASSGVPSVGPSGSSSSRSSSGGGVVAANSVVAGNGAGTSSVVKSSGTNGSNSGSIGWRNSRHGSTASWHGPSRHNSHVPCNRRMHSTPLVTNKAGQLPVMGRREHKAARTLGLIMGAFVLCWLPFFTWYVSINVCGPSCRCPHAVVTALFWIGYFNSTLNPFIYAYFRTDFRDAFHRTLKRMSCCRPRQPAGVFV